jgi:hypothetical protein
MRILVREEEEEEEEEEERLSWVVFVVVVVAEAVGDEASSSTLWRAFFFSFFLSFLGLEEEPMINKGWRGSCVLLCVYKGERVRCFLLQKA